MIIQSTLALYAGGIGSGCHGPNCGRVKWGGGLRTRVVPLSKVRTNPFNAFVSRKTVAEYLQKMKDGKRIEPPDAYQASNGKYILVDGHHRTAAARKFGEKTIKLEMHDIKDVPRRMVKIR